MVIAMATNRTLALPPLRKHYSVEAPPWLWSITSLLDERAMRSALSVPLAADPHELAPLAHASVAEVALGDVACTPQPRVPPIDALSAVERANDDAPESYWALLNAVPSVCVSGSPTVRRVVPRTQPKVASTH